MGTIVLSSQKTTDPAPFQYVVTVPDTDIDRLIMAWAPVLYPGGKDSNGNPVTGAMVFQRLTERVVSDIKTQTENYLKSQAAAAAAAGVAPISVTPV